MSTPSPTTPPKRSAWAVALIALLLIGGVALIALGLVKSRLEGPDGLIAPDKMVGRMLVWRDADKNQRLTAEILATETPTADVQVILMWRRQPEDPEGIPDAGHLSPTEFDLPVFPGAQQFVSQELADTFVFMSYSLQGATDDEVATFYRDELAGTPWVLESDERILRMRPGLE